MKTICTLNGRIVMWQDGMALVTMQGNANQYLGAVASVVSDTQYAALLAAQTDWLKTKIAEVKVEAQQRIFIVLPQWKQANLTARLGEFHEQRLSGGTLTVGEQSEVTAGFVLWSKVKAIRAASDLIEADIQASTDPEKFDVAGSPRWPA